MSKETSLKLFEDKQIRTFWDENKEKWYISVIDVIQVLTETERPRKYWSDLKTKLKPLATAELEKLKDLKRKHLESLGIPTSGDIVIESWDFHASFRFSLKK